MGILLRSILVALLFTILACGGGGGDGGGFVGGVDYQSTVNDDLTTLTSKPTLNGQSVDAEFNGAYSKIFGGTSSTDVARFINERVTHVFDNKQVMSFRVSARGAPQQGFSLSEIYGDNAGNLGDTLVGVNHGVSLWQVSQQINLPFDVYAPNEVIQVNSPRVGLIGVTRKFTTIDIAPGSTIPRPREGRVGTLIHEGRHSDCQVSPTSDFCGYSHMTCPSDHAYAGLDACDNLPWGSYAVEAIYFRGAMNNYPSGSRNHRILEFSFIDTLSRLTADARTALETTSPNLKSDF